MSRMHSTDDPQAAKLEYVSAWAAIGKRPAGQWSGALMDLYHGDLAWHGPHPINSHRGAATVLEKFWRPFLASFPDIERRDDILIAGSFAGGTWVGATGYYAATFAHDWLGIRATGGVVNLHYGEFSRMQAGKVHEVYLIVDILDLMRQAACWPPGVPKGRGLMDRVPGPATRDGVALAASAPGESKHSLELVEAMIKGLLLDYDGRTLESMAQERFWHPHMMWYGPAGIGTSRQLKGFQDVHQRPFLQAFPDRMGGDHKARIADGAYVGSTGWPSVRATHLGPWLGCAPSGRRIGMRVMDFWRREGNLLRENWVFIDLIDLFLQMDVDVMSAIR